MGINMDWGVERGILSVAYNIFIELHLKLYACFIL